MLLVTEDATSVAPKVAAHRDIMASAMMSLQAAMLLRDSLCDDTATLHSFPRALASDPHYPSKSCRTNTPTNKHG
jgi:hypothetical protein